MLCLLGGAEHIIMFVLVLVQRDMTSYVWGGGVGLGPEGQDI